MKIGRGRDGITRRSTRKDPAIILRFRTQKEMNDVRRAAKSCEMSLNAYMRREILAQARRTLMYGQ